MDDVLRRRACALLAQTKLIARNTLSAAVVLVLVLVLAWTCSPSHTSLITTCVRTKLIFPFLYSIFSFLVSLKISHRATTAIIINIPTWRLSARRAPAISAPRVGLSPRTATCPTLCDRGSEHGMQVFSATFHDIH